MNLTHFKPADVDHYYDQNSHVEGISFGDRVFSLFLTSDNLILIEEDCDGAFSKTLTKEDTLVMLQEAIDWVKSRPQNFNQKTS